MRTMMKKCGRMRAYAGVCAVALLVMAALVTSCTNPSGSESSGYKPPAGKGAVKLNLDKTTRSIAPGTTISSFTTFDVQFDAVSGGGGLSVSFNGVSSANIAGPYDLEPGTYDITVVGYIGTSEAAIGELNNVSILPNQTTTTSVITLHAYDISDGGTGTFSWTISNSMTGSLTVASMTFSTITGGTAPTTVDLLDNKWNGSITNFPVGYYYVDFVLVKDSKTRTFRHILHIYKGQTSSFTYTFDNSYFTFAKVTIPPVVYEPPADKQPELETVVGGGSGTTVLPKGTVIVSLSNTTYPDVLDIVVTNDTDYDANVKWYLNGTTPLTSVSGTLNTILTVDVSNPPFNAIGLYQLTVEGTKSSVPYETFIYISIVP